MHNILKELYKEKNDTFLNGGFCHYIPVGLVILHIHTIRDIRRATEGSPNSELIRAMMVGSDYDEVWNLLLFLIKESGLRLLDMDYLPIPRKKVERYLEKSEEGLEFILNNFVSIVQVINSMHRAIAFDPNDKRITEFLAISAISQRGDLDLIPEFGKMHDINFPRTDKEKEIVKITKSFEKRKRPVNQLHKEIARLRDKIIKDDGLIKNPSANSLWEKMRSMFSDESNTSKLKSLLKEIDGEKLVWMSENYISQELKRTSFDTTYSKSININYPPK